MSGANNLLFCHGHACILVTVIAQFEHSYICANAKLKQNQIKYPKKM